MKIWKFYKKPDSELLGDEYSELYAYTNNKNIANKFKKDRNMKKFYMFTDIITKDEYTELTSVKAGNRLDEFAYSTYDSTNKKFIHTYVVSTVNEHETIIEMSVEGNLVFELKLVNPFIFKKKYRKALENLHYIQFFKIRHPEFCLNLRETVEYSDIDDDMHELDDYSTPNFDIDELFLFCKLYGELFK